MTYREAFEALCVLSDERGGDDFNLEVSTWKNGNHEWTIWSPASGEHYKGRTADDAFANYRDNRAWGMGHVQPKEMDTLVGNADEVAA